MCANRILNGVVLLVIGCFTILKFEVVTCVVYHGVCDVLIINHVTFVLCFPYLENLWSRFKQPVSHSSVPERKVEIGMKVATLSEGVGGSLPYRLYVIVLCFESKFCVVLHCVFKDDDLLQAILITWTLW